MAIKQRSGGADDGGGSDAAPIRRLKKLPGIRSGSYPIGKPKKKVVLGGELGDLMSQWNAAAPGTIHMLSDTVSYGRVPTGILSIDLCLAGGFKRSRASMLYGERSAGKSTVCGKLMAHCLMADPEGFAVYIDIEGTADKDWFITLGCDPDRILIIEPATGEDAVDQADAVLRSESTCFVAIDSIAMLTPFKEIDSSAEDNQIGLQARLIGKMLRRLQNALLQERRREHHPILMALNQFRMKAGLVFGDPRTLPGGKALEFVMSQQLELKNKEIKDEKTGIIKWNEHSGTVTKDKTGGRMKDFKFKLIRDEDATNLPLGYIDQAESIKEFGLASGIFTVRGSTIDTGHYGTYKSVDNFRRYLIDNPEVEAQLCLDIIAQYRTKWKIED